MGLFSQPKVVVLKESSEAKKYLQQLEELQAKASGDLSKKIAREISITKAGIIGEDNILFELKNSGMDMVILHDLYIESKSGNSAQIDFLVLTPKINFVIECKNLFGNIEITSRGEFIRTVEYGGKRFQEGIYSPITQNQRHLQVIKECRQDIREGLMKLFGNFGFESYFKGLVVLANPKTLVNDREAKKEVKDQVIRADQLIETIKRMSKASSNLSSAPKELLQDGQRYLEMNRENPTDYLKKFEDMVLEMEQTEKEDKPEEEQKTEEKIPEENCRQEVTPEKKETNEQNDISTQKMCPRCGMPLVLREAKRGNHIGEKFYGCSGFPKCRYTEKMKPDEE